MQKTRRQFSIEIIRCDGFVSMPATAQALYLQLVMSCDDEGFTSSVELCKFLAHADDDDEQMLIEREFIIQFENKKRKVTVIKHWWMNNWIQGSKVVPSSFSERSSIYVKPNGNYTLDYKEGKPLARSQTTEKLPRSNQTPTENLPSDYQEPTEHLETQQRKKKQERKTSTNPTTPQSNYTSTNPIQSNPTTPQSNEDGAGDDDPFA